VPPSRLTAQGSLGSILGKRPDSKQAEIKCLSEIRPWHAPCWPAALSRGGRRDNAWPSEVAGGGCLDPRSFSRQRSA